MLLRLAPLSVAAAVLACLAGCGSDRVLPGPCASGSVAPNAMAAAAVREPLLGMLMRPDTSIFLARLDPLSLKPISRPVELGEYHDAWSRSPDGTELALGISAPGKSGRIGVLIVNAKRMRIVREIETGGAAEALAWFTPRLLAAGLVTDGTVLIDPSRGEVLQRWPNLSDPEASARIPDGLVMLFRGPASSSAKGSATAAARLAIIDAGGHLRSIILERIKLRTRYANGTFYTDDAGLAVDPTRARAYVFAADAPVAEVDLHSMSVSYHRVGALFLRPGELGGIDVQPDSVGARSRRAVWLRDGRVLVFGRELVPSGSGDFETLAAGAIVVDTGTWGSCTVDATASGANVVQGRILSYGPAGTGIRVFTLQGRNTRHLLDGEHVWFVEAAGNRAYVRGPRTTYVVDVKADSVLEKIIPPRDLVDAVVER